MHLDLIANSGIQAITFPLTVDIQARHKLWYHEWYDTNSGEWRLEPIYELQAEEGGNMYYDKYILYQGGYLAETEPLNPSELKADGITPLRIGDDNCAGVEGEIFKMTFADKNMGIHISHETIYAMITQRCQR